VRKAQQTAVNRGKQIGVAANDERNTAQLSTNSSIGWLPTMKKHRIVAQNISLISLFCGRMHSRVLWPCLDRVAEEKMFGGSVPQPLSES
jgi:hypothetical protein